MDLTENKKRTIHVFASDILPFEGSIRSAGSNRSLQIINSLRQAGHDVTYSMSLTSYLAREQYKTIVSRLTKEELWRCENFFEPEIVLNRVQPEIAIYCNVNCFRTVGRYARDVIQIIDLNGPLHFEGLFAEAADPRAAMDDPAILTARCESLVTKLRDADYLITVSERQRSFWMAYCSLAGIDLQNFDILVCPFAFDVPPLARNPASNLNIVHAGAFYPWQDPSRFLSAAAEALDQIDGAVLNIFGGAHAGLANEHEVAGLIDRLKKHRSVRYHGFRPVDELNRTLSTCWAALDLMERNLERELAINGRTLQFLGTGTPVIYNDYATLSPLIRKYRAGWTAPTDDVSVLLPIFNELREGGPALVDELSRNALRLVASEFDPLRSMEPLVTLCSGPVHKRTGPSAVSTTSTARLPVASAPAPQIGHVLAISPDPAGALGELRVNNPLRALQRQGLIAGFRCCDLSFESLKDDPTPYEAVIIQRTVPEYIYETFQNLAIPFILDVDDHLLARASYRHEPPERGIVVGLQYCSVLTTPNPRLIKLLEQYSGIPLAAKGMVTPNGLPYPASTELKPTRPSQIIWIQSDIAALASSRDAVVRAVDEFSRKHSLPIVLIGKNVVGGPTFKHAVVMGQIDFASNLQLLQFAPTSIGVAPLETAGDPETLDFIAGKSDLKILLFAGYGHPGVYSAAPPYADSPLQHQETVIGNSHKEWVDALEYQLNDGWRTMAERTHNIQQQRHIDVVARESWAPAVSAGILPKPVRGFTLYNALIGSQKMENSPAHLLGYMTGNEDILWQYLSAPDSSGSAWDHYDAHGRSEHHRRLLHGANAQTRLLSRLDAENSQALQRLDSTLTHMRHTIMSLRKEVMDLRSSLSWRITAPLRSLAKPLMERGKDPRTLRPGASGRR